MIQRFLSPLFAAAILLSPGIAAAEKAEGSTAAPAASSAAASAAPATSATSTAPATASTTAPVSAGPDAAAPAATANTGNAADAAQSPVPAPAPSSSPSSDVGSSLLQLGFGFMVVMAVLFGCLWLLKRLNAPQGRSVGLMKVVTALPLGTRERAVLIEVGDQWLLVGMGPNYMVKLADVPRQELPPSSPGQTVPDFASWLKRALDQRKGGTPNA